MNIIESIQRFAIQRFNDFVGYIDFILNLAGVLLWVNWRSTLFDPFTKRTPATLVGTLRRAAPQRFRRWHLLAALGALLVLRALFYWQVGSAAHWSGKLNLGVTMLFFSSDSFGRILLFSLLSFGLTLGIFYLWLLLLSILRGPEPMHRLVRIPLGEIDNWPRGIKLFLPLVVTALLWWLASWIFSSLQIMPQPVSTAHRLGEAFVIGLESYVAWKFVVGALLALRLLNTYVYFGRHPFWSYVNATAQTLLSPLQKIPLRVGKADFTPIVGIALAFLIAEAGERGLIFLYGRLLL